MAIQLCPVDTANVHPRNILGSSSSFDRERLSPFGSLSSRCWEPVSLLHVRKQVSLSSAQVGRFNGVPRLLWSTSPSAPGRPSLVANPARKGTLSSIARTPPAVASRRYARTGGQRLVEAGRSVLFAPAYRLVQDLLAAKRDPSCWTTWATCPRVPRNRRCSSPSSPNATNAGPWASRPTWSSPSGSRGSPYP